MGDKVDHLVVGSADLETGVRWVVDRLGVAPIFGGVHEGWGTRNALLGLGEQYLEVLALDPAQPEVSIPWRERLREMTTPALLTIAVARSPLSDPVPMARVRADGVRMDWELQFTETPVFFIDWKQAPRPTGLPDGGRVTSLRVTSPKPHELTGVDGIVVREGPWSIEASIDGTRLV